MISMASSSWTFLILYFVATLVAAAATAVAAEDSGLQTKCSPSITKVYPCVNYASGKENSPSSECCSAVTTIRSDNPVCLCYIYQLTHQGSSTVESLGLQFDRLIQLPGACKLANSSASDCPKLLGLSPNSPDYNIFSENATAVTSPGASSPNASPGPSSSSDRTARHIRMDVYAVAIAVLSAIFSNAFQGGA